MSLTEAANIWWAFGGSVIYIILIGFVSTVVSGSVVGCLLIMRVFSSMIGMMYYRNERAMVLMEPAVLVLTLGFCTSLYGLMALLLGD